MPLVMIQLTVLSAVESWLLVNAATTVYVPALDGAVDEPVPLTVLPT